MVESKRGFEQAISLWAAWQPPQPVLLISGDNVSKDVRTHYATVRQICSACRNGSLHYRNIKIRPVLFHLSQILSPGCKDFLRRSRRSGLSVLELFCWESSCFFSFIWLFLCFHKILKVSRNHCCLFYLASPFQEFHFLTACLSVCIWETSFLQSEYFFFSLHIPLTVYCICSLLSFLQNHYF